MRAHNSFVTQYSCGSPQISVQARLDGKGHLHAARHAILAADLEPDADPPKVLIVGPDEAGNLIELVALELGDDELLVIHAMTLRPTFRKWLEGER